MVDWVRSVFGEASLLEIALVCAWFVVIILHRHVPRLGGAIGSWLDRKGRQP